MRLKNKVAIVTGGGSGIGEATCLRFAQEGASVVVVDKNGSDANTVVSKIKAAAGEATGKDVDVTNREQVDQMIHDIVSKYGRIDILINNAGITADAKLEKMTEEQWNKVINVNLKGVFNCGQGVAKIMKQQGSGVLLNSSSVVGIYGNFGQTNYAASKWGVIGMTKTWAKELGRYNIRVNAVAPGFTLTPMVQKMPEKVLTMIREKSPLKKLAQPIDIANAFLFLASDEANFITGTVLSVDGGVVL
ncbi:beta-ketoacyl-ACP reductase [Marinisporobacter balticus]|uniref:3-oxoacyl-[acyl-carrier-protein] reductase n=1 Tax=Marinisporobacter balticus TaxID=2018667 RepID=A0A4R2LFE0_9FIRM|nr:beta-ketoacyl-ACP reductase [Marinisporobacter balticus]TCO77975.1 3-oxoacyl-[acyl-carrier-protein] reductase [Marinisporobacter balticus]